MSQVFALCDANNFYVSCERVFDANLIGRPVVVLSNNDGCIIARSNEAKAIGIKMGTPIFEIKDVIQNNCVKVFSSNYALYGDMSNRVMGVLQDLTPDVEVYSIDEAFLRFDKENESLTKTGRTIKETVYKWTGIPVSIGLGETKTLAKLANRLAKKSEKAKGVLDLSQSPFQDYALECTPVADVWGIGRQSEKKLKTKGITNAKQLRDIDLRWAKRNLTVVGARIIEELRGISCIPFESAPPPKKSVTVSRSFGNVVTSLEGLKQAVAFFTVRASEKLRRNKLCASAITIFAATNRFAKNETYYSNSVTIEMAYPTSAMNELMERAMTAIEKIYKPYCNFKKAGVMFTGLVPEDTLTKRLYDDDEGQKQKRLSDAMDRINNRFGRDAIRLGIIDGKQSWKTKFQKRSKRYTTNWNELLKIA